MKRLDVNLEDGGICADDGTTLRGKGDLGRSVLCSARASVVDWLKEIKDVNQTIADCL